MNLKRYLIDNTCFEVIKWSSKYWISRRLLEMIERNKEKEKYFLYILILRTHLLKMTSPLFLIEFFRILSKSNYFII